MKIAAGAPLSLEGAVAPQLHMQLRNRIITCDLPPGQRISESDIATSYQVSRQPVREAFIKLAEEQLVSVRPQRGTFVTRISVSAALTSRFVREAVEADLVRRVVDRATPEMIAALDQEIAAQHEVVKAGDPAAFIEVDEAFHRKIAAFAGVPAVSQYLEGLNTSMNRVRNISAREFAPGKLVTQHAAIVEAIRQGDAAGAEQEMRNHMREINRDLPPIVAAYPDFFEDIEALTLT